MRTIVSNEVADRQSCDARSERMVSLVHSASGWRFVEEELVRQPAEGALPAHTYWEERHRSGIYETADLAWAAALIEVRWLPATLSKS